MLKVALTSADHAVVGGTGSHAASRAEVHDDRQPVSLTERLVAGAPMLVMVVDQVGTVTWIDGAVTELTGHEPDDVLGTNILDHLDLEWNPSAFDSIEAALGGTGLQRPMLYRVFRKDGSAFVAEVTANSQIDDPVVRGLAVYVRRWDERHLLDQVLESLASDASLDDTLQLLTRVMGAETLDADSVVMLHGAGTALDRSVTHLTLDDALTAGGDATDAPWYEAARREAPVWRPIDDVPAPAREVARRAGYRWCWAWPVFGPERVEGALVLWRRQDEEPDHTCRMLLATLERLTGLVLQQQRAADRLRHAASHDPLTGLANRAQFMERLEDALDQDAHGPLVGVLYVDLDDFKPVNDRLGHGAGDQVLCEIARRLQASVRDGDLVARLGGDEFTVVCAGVTDPRVLSSVAERLTNEVRRPIHVGDQVVRLSASVGVALAPPGDCSIDVLLEAADAALYAVKGTRRGGWRAADLPRSTAN